MKFHLREEEKKFFRSTTFSIEFHYLVKKRGGD